ncbi:MAG: PGF-CTERM protein [Halobacteriales archaeon]|jgi:PGF-CTERM protein
MKRETALIAALVAVVVASALALLLIPGALGDPGDERDVPSGRLHVVEMPIEVGTVSKQTATLTVNAKLQHRGPSMENVSVVIRAIDEERGVVETKTRVDLGTVEEETEVPATATLTVDRQGAYRFEVIAYTDGKRVPGGDGSRVIEGIGSLEPTYEQSSIEFQRFENSEESLPSIGYSIADTGDGTVTLALSTRLINGGTQQAGDLTLVLLARQADSNVIADRTTVQVGQIQPGQTRPTEAELTVPDDYNYYLVGLLKRDDVIVDTTRSAANLDPNKTTVVVNETTQEDSFDAGDFDSSDDEEPPERETRTESGGGSGPGFGIGIALIALLAVATLAAKRNRH